MNGRASDSVRRLFRFMYCIRLWSTIRWRLTVSYVRCQYHVGTEFQDDVDVSFVFEALDELHNVDVAGRLVQLDLREELWRAVSLTILGMDNARSAVP